MWLDGICKECGCIVIEMSDTSGQYDYQNFCANPKCNNHKMHRQYDDEFQDYYVHNNSKKILMGI